MFLGFKGEVAIPFMRLPQHRCLYVHEWKNHQNKKKLVDIQYQKNIDDLKTFFFNDSILY